MTKTRYVVRQTPSTEALFEVGDFVRLKTRLRDAGWIVIGRRVREGIYEYSIAGRCNSHMSVWEDKLVPMPPGDEGFGEPIAYDRLLRIQELRDDPWAFVEDL